MFGFLNNIDFRGILGLGAATSLDAGQIADLASNYGGIAGAFLPSRSDLVNGWTDKNGHSHQGIQAYLNMGYGVVQGDQPSNAMSDDQIVATVESIIGKSVPTSIASDGGVVNFLKSAAASAVGVSNPRQFLYDTLAKLRGDGYYIVRGSGSSAPPQQTTAWGAVKFTPQAPTGWLGQPRQTQSSGPSYSVVNRTRRMTPAEKTKLYWALGIGGLVFVVAIGVIAAGE